MRCWRAGDYAEALSIGQEGAGTARKLGLNVLLIFALAGLGAVRRALFDLEAAPTIHQEAQAVNAAFPSLPLVELVASELCADWAQPGDWDKATRMPGRRWRVGGGRTFRFRD